MKLEESENKNTTINRVWGKLLTLYVQRNNKR